MKRLTLAFFAVSVLVGLSVSTALAQWPTNCVELNDVIEAGRGNHENVGISKSSAHRYRLGVAASRIGRFPLLRLAVGCSDAGTRRSAHASRAS